MSLKLRANVQDSLRSEPTITQTSLTSFYIFEHKKYLRTDEKPFSLNMLLW